MNFITTKLTFDENPVKFAPRMPWPREPEFYKKQIDKPIYVSEQILPVQLTISENQSNLQSSQTPKRKFSLNANNELAIENANQNIKNHSYGSSFNLSAKVWFVNKTLMLILDPLTRPKEVTTKGERRRSSILRALGRGGIPSDAGVEQRRRSSLLSLLSNNESGVRRKSSIVDAIKKGEDGDEHSSRRSSIKSLFSKKNNEKQSNTSNNGDGFDEGPPQFNLNWHENDVQNHDHQPSTNNTTTDDQAPPQHRRWSTKDTSIQQQKPYPLYINDKPLTIINIPIESITAAHTTKLEKEESIISNNEMMSPPQSPKASDKTVGFDDGHNKRENIKRIAKEPATIELEIQGKRTSTNHNSADGIISIEFWDIVTGQIEADTVHKYIELVRNGKKF